MARVQPLRCAVCRKSLPATEGAAVPCRFSPWHCTHFWAKILAPSSACVFVYSGGAFAAAWTEAVGSLGCWGAAFVADEWDAARRDRPSRRSGRRLGCRLYVIVAGRGYQRSRGGMHDDKPASHHEFGTAQGLSQGVRAIAARYGDPGEVSEMRAIGWCGGWGTTRVNLRCAGRHARAPCWRERPPGRQARRFPLDGRVQPPGM